MKKNTLIGFNIVLSIAVIILFYLHFAGNTIKTEEKLLQEDIANTETPQEELGAELKIGYINVDSLQIKYGLYEELKTKLKAKQTRYEREIATRSKAFQRKIEEFREKAPSMAKFELELKQKELAQEEQDLYKMEEKYSTKFQDEFNRLNSELYETIKDYIHNYNKEKKYDLIIGESQTRNFVLDFNEELDITNIIVNGLNQQYDEKINNNADSQGKEKN